MGLDELIPENPRQASTKTDSASKIEKVGISVRGGNIDVYNLTDNVIVHVIEHDNKDVYIVERDEEGNIRTRAAGKYSLAGPVEEMLTCDHCHKPIWSSQPMCTVLCSICHSGICRDCVDFDCMNRTNTEDIICIEFSQLFEKCKEGSCYGRR